VALIAVPILAAQIAALQNVATPISVIQIVAVVLAVVQISAQSAAVLTVVQIVVQTLAQSVVLVLVPLAVLPSRVDQLEESRVVVPVPADSRGSSRRCTESHRARVPVSKYSQHRVNPQPSLRQPACAARR
jgi:hypothetical protein